MKQEVGNVAKPPCTYRYLSFKYKREIRFLFMLQKYSNSKKGKMDCICINSACQKFRLGDSYTENTAISFYANMVCTQLTAKNGTHVELE